MTRITTIELPDGPSNAWAHPGATTGVDGLVHVAAIDGRRILQLDGTRVVGAIEVPTTECHGLAAVADGSLWIADPGNKGHLEDGSIVTTTAAGRVVLVGTGGDLLRRITPPTGEWMPTGVAVHDFGRASEGCLFVADGYGAGLVHCFDSSGSLRWTIDGADTGRVFSTPHGITVDTRVDPPRLLVADRGNRRVVAFTLDGRPLGEFGSDFLTSPSSFVIEGESLWITELFGAIVAVSTEGRLLQRIGTTDHHVEPSWPNRLLGNDIAAPLPPGAFRSPHGIAVDRQGRLVVAEWVIGGRISVVDVS